MTKVKATPRLRRNYELAPGVMRFSAARMYARRGVYAKKSRVSPSKKAEAPKKFIEKPIGGDKNGGTRRVIISKSPKFLPEGGKLIKKEKRSTKKVPLRSSITPGTILIILAGRHKGKRVIFLKQLEKTGLLLVTGPMKLNSTPLRRIAQAFVIATKMKIDVSNVNVPEHINDEYFRRINIKKAPKKGDGDIFAQGTTEYVVSEQRKTDQKAVDAPILETIRNHPEKKFLFSYLARRFSLGKNQHPHEMMF